MKLECVVEGVETKERLAILQDLGCDCFQGYLFARPKPLPMLLRSLAEQMPAVRRPPVASPPGLKC